MAFGLGKRTRCTAIISCKHSAAGVLLRRYLWPGSGIIQAPQAQFPFGIMPGGQSYHWISALRAAVDDKGGAVSLLRHANQRKSGMTFIQSVDIALYFRL